MEIYLRMILVSAVVVYIVDLSGFTESWRDALARWLKVGRLRPLPPLDCGQCMSWWTCLVYALCMGELTLGTVAWSAFLAFMSTVTGGVLTLFREIAITVINRIIDRL